MKKQSSARTYVLFRNYEDRYTPHWQFRNEPRVPGCMVNEFGDCYPPPFQLVVRAKSAKQACWMANESVTSQSEPDQLGIWWERDEHLGPPPLGKDIKTYPTTVALCRAPTAMAHDSLEDAEKALNLIDRFGCGGACCGNHEIVWMTINEGKKRGFAWYHRPPSQCDE